MSEFGKNLKKIREENDWTLEEMAKKLDTTKQALSRYERGDRQPKITIAARIAEKLNIPLATLTGLEEEETSSINSQDADRLEALHQNPRLGLLFDHTRKMSSEDVDLMLQMAERIVKERDGE